MLDLTRLSEAVGAEGGITRRLALAYGAALAALPSLASRTHAANRKVSFAGEPFQLGVASGDPDATSVVLWTRLAPKPLDPDGGMKPEPVAVSWEVAEDDAMKKVVASGKATAVPQLAHSVHAVAQGLKPDRWYWYRFRAGDAASPIGRTRTLPAADAEPERLKFAFTSCQNYEQGLYTAYQHMAKDDPDLVFHLGDYIYEGPPTDLHVRKHLIGPATTRLKSLTDYRGRYAQYRSDALLQGMHARCPWFVTWDDHEVDNNYANDIPSKNKNPKLAVDPVVFLEQRAAAYQAYYEIMPLRSRSLPHGPDMRLYRKAVFGRLAQFLVLDTRQYRTDQPNDDGLKPLNEASLKPSNTLLGRKQRGWLDANLLTSAATWNVLAQQVMMAMIGLGRDDAGETTYAMDSWSGAAHERMALARFLVERKVPNPVVLTGDVHSNWVNDLRVDDRKADTPVVATEFVGTSISTGGNGKGTPPKAVADLMAVNPCVQFHNRQRGYVRCTVTPKEWRSDYIVLSDVTKPNQPANCCGSFVLEEGKRGARKA